MNVSPTMQKTNAGTCPHGNPVGTCPMCSGMGMGGSHSSGRARKPGEMTYEQCYAIWQQMLKAKAAAEEQKLQQKLQQAHAQENIKTFSDKIMDKITALNIKAAALNTKIEQNPTIKSKISLFMANTVLTTMNIMHKTLHLVQKTISFIQQKFADISDKLTAIYGEIKLALKKRITDKFNFKTKLKSIFHIYNPLDIENEEKKIDEEKFLFRLRTTLSKIKEKYTKRKK